MRRGRWRLVSVAFLVGALACEFEGAPAAGAGEGSPEDTPADPPSDVDPTDDDDRDGVANGDDNCWAKANPLQRDEDGDQRGDVCDNCPATPNADQENNGESQSGADRDGLGDACDPRPVDSGDRLAFFSPFLDPLAPEWTVLGPATWAVEADGTGLRRNDSNGAGTVYIDGMALDDVVVRTRLTVGIMDRSGEDVYGVATVSHFDGANGYACIERRGDDANTLGVYEFRPTQVIEMGAASAQPQLDTGRKIELEMTAIAAAGTVACSRLSDGTDSSQQAAADAVTGMVGLHTYSTGATFEYIAVYQLGGP